MVKIPSGVDGAAHYLPDFAPEAYTPPGVAPNPWQYLTVFLPDETLVGARPERGWPVLLATGFGGFACTPPASEIRDLASDVLQLLYGALERGIAVVSFGVTGSDSDRYAPGGDLHGGEFSIPAPVKGLGTFDAPVPSPPAGLDHHDDVGASLDGGVTYPHQDFPTPYEDGQLARQWLEERASAWGIDSSKVYVHGRSAGNLVAQHLVWSPDRADPEMMDHRRNTTRCAGAIMFAHLAWLPAWPGGTSQGPVKFFPNAADPEGQVSTDLDDVPAIYPREASGLRILSRDYSNLGPGVTGEEIRAQNGALPVYLLAGDASLGLAANTTPTEALEFVNDESTNNRLPSLVGNLAAGTGVLPNVQHPAIQGPMTRSRLLELDVDGVQASTGVCVLRQATRDELVGELDTNGGPAEALVTHVYEDLESEFGMVGVHAAVWLRGRMDELAALDPQPETSTLVHPRTLVRRAFLSVLQGLEVPWRSDGSLVTVREAWGQPWAESELPAIAIDVADDGSEALNDQRQPSYSRTLQVQVQLQVSAGPQRGAADLAPTVPGQLRWQRQLEQLLLAVEERVPGVAKLIEQPTGTEQQLALERLHLTGVESDVSNDGDRILGALTSTWEAQWHESLPRTPETLLALQKLFAEIDTAPADGTPEIEAHVYPEQL